MPQCKSVSDQGLRCGLDEGHDGHHYAITPCDAKWPLEPSKEIEPVKDHQLIDGEPCTLDRLCREEPDWAASIIRHHRKLFCDIVKQYEAHAIPESPHPCLCACPKCKKLIERCKKAAMYPPEEGGWK